MGRNSGENIKSAKPSYRTPATVLAAERTIRGDGIETAFVFDRKGNVLKMVKGTSNSVAIGKVPKDSVVTHNHPSNASFSPADIMTAIGLDMAEIRAVGKTYTYSLTRPKKGWGDPAKAIAEYNKASKEAKVEVDAFFYRGIAMGLDRSKGANLLLPHLEMKKFAKTMGWEYTKTRIK